MLDGQEGVRVACSDPRHRTLEPLASAGPRGRSCRSGSFCGCRWWRPLQLEQVTPSSHVLEPGAWGLLAEVFQRSLGIHELTELVAHDVAGEGLAGHRAEFPFGSRRLCSGCARLLADHEPALHSNDPSIIAHGVRPAFPPVMLSGVLRGAAVEPWRKRQSCGLPQQAARRTGHGRRCMGEPASHDDRFWTTEIWENQWRPRGGVWSDSPPPECSAAILRPSWSTEDGSLALHPTAVWCPDGFEWDSRGWVLDLNPEAGLGAAQDAQGWSYAPSWSVLESGGAAMNPRPTWPVAVRRRRYTRRARRWASLPVRAPSAAGRQPPAAADPVAAPAPVRARAGEGALQARERCGSGDSPPRGAHSPPRRASEATPAAARCEAQRGPGAREGAGPALGSAWGGMPAAACPEAALEAAGGASEGGAARATGSLAHPGGLSQSGADGASAGLSRSLQGWQGGASAAGLSRMARGDPQPDAQGRTAQSLACEADTDVDTALALAELRDREIRKVAGDAVAIQSLMRQVAEAVSEQGEAVDRIDAHTREAHGSASDGAAHLEHAHAAADSCSAM